MNDSTDASDTAQWKKKYVYFYSMYGYMKFQFVINKTSEV